MSMLLLAVSSINTSESALAFLLIFCLTDEWQRSSRREGGKGGVIASQALVQASLRAEPGRDPATLEAIEDREGVKFQSIVEGLREICSGCTN
jgi:hypothetical protein